MERQTKGVEGCSGTTLGSIDSMAIESLCDGAQCIARYEARPPVAHVRAEICPSMRKEMFDALRQRGHPGPLARTHRG